jgi:3-oxoacyl-[acyl-carrier protein] reductase
MDLGLSGRVALITGGSKGIGRAIALALAAEAVDTAICARDRAALDATAAEVHDRGRRCLSVQTDLSDDAGCRRFVETATAHFGRADILVCCANSPGPSGGFTEIPDARWLSHMAIKVHSAVRCARAVLPLMRANRWGRIILVGGMATRVVRPLTMDNGPTCAALTNFGRQLAAQVIQDGIRVNSIHPDLTRTPLILDRLAREAATRSVSVAEVEREATAALPLGRLIEPEEVAHLAVFLCSELAGAITGQSLAVDGGSAGAVFY